MDMNQTNFEFRRAIWINDMVFRHILLLISLYLLIALVYHQLTTSRQQGNTDNSAVQKYEYYSKYTCIAVAVVSFLRHATKVIGGYLEANNGVLSHESVEIFCDIVRPVASFALTAGSTLVFLFLWFRQRAFFVYPRLRITNQLCLHIVSFSIIIVWILFWIAMLVVFVVNITYRFDESGICQYELATQSDWTYGEIIIVWSVASFLMHVCLIGLFVYPLLRLHLRLRSSQNRNENDEECIKRNMKKALIIAIICFITDIISGVILLIFYKENANTPTFSYSTNLVINHLATIVWFDYWRELLWPWNSQCCRFTIMSAVTYDVQQEYSTFTNPNSHTSIREPASAACSADKYIKTS